MLHAQLAPDDPTLALELLCMTDAFTDDLFASTPFEAGGVSGRPAGVRRRAICQRCRRMALRGMSAVYVKTSDEGPLREHLTAAERALGP